ncbi:MAG: membrane protein insertase YidC [Chitinivibrionales bacterium]|nr:membrane protein insertase YidC [Chitinivibrionales bacterium]
MNRNTTIALVLILLTVIFFNSRFYYEKIRQKPYPYDRKGQVTQQVEPADTTVADTGGRDTAGQARGEGSGGDTLAQADTGRAERGPTPPEQEAEAVAVDTAETAEAGADTIWVETDRLVAGISERGARIVSLRMKQYQYRNEREGREDSLIQLIPQGTPGGAGLKIDTEDYASVVFEAATDAGRITVGEGESKTVTFVGETPGGREIRKTFGFESGSYLIELAVESNALAGRNVTVSWAGGITESEWGVGGQSGRYDRRSAHLFDGEDVEKFQKKKEQSIDRTGMYKWVGLTSKYFLVSLIGNESRENDVRIWSFADTITRADPKAGNMNFAFSWTRMADGTREAYEIYAGPMQIERLREIDVGLQKVLFGGWRWFLWADKWFPWLCQMMLGMLIGLYGVFRDYGVAILLVTLVVKVITYPLSLSSMKSMARMKEVQPKITAIRERYKSDARKMNEELMELYRKEGINPFNPGCLPMFLQMPILISLFVVLRKAIELRGASTVLVPWVNDLSQAEVLFTLPFSIPGYGSNFALIPIVMAALTFVQNKMTMKDPNQKAMVYVMPIVMLVLFNNFPAGLVMYWTFSSALGLVQQRLIERARERVTGGGTKNEGTKTAKRPTTVAGRKRR